MKTQRELRVGRGAIRYCWKAAEHVSRISADVRYANKPSDLNYPISELTNLVRSLDLYRTQWLAKWLDARDERLDQWPKLWERYL